MVNTRKIRYTKCRVILKKNLKPFSKKILNFFQEKFSKISGKIRQRKT